MRFAKRGIAVNKYIGLVLSGLVMSTALALPARATPVKFDITGISLNPGSGYGKAVVDLTEAN